MNTIEEELKKILLPSLVTDIGSSLGGTLSATQALLNGAVQDPELRRDLLGGIENELHYLRFLFENWILIQVFRNGKVGHKLRRINLSEWLKTSLVPWQKSAQEKELQLKLHLAENLPDLDANPDYLSQAIGNIIFASLSCAPHTSMILVEARVAQEVIKINIYDSGPQINPFIVFNDLPDYQKFENHPRLRRGLGLGIILANRVILAHKGEMIFEDAQPFNFCVSIHLPYPSPLMGTSSNLTGN